MNHQPDQSQRKASLIQINARTKSFVKSLTKYYAVPD